MSWATTELSTRDSVSRIEYELGNASIISDPQMASKISLAKSLIGAEIEIYLTIEKKITVNEADGEVLLDVITNPTVLSTASDYLVASLCYEDISGNDINSLYIPKAKKHRYNYEQLLESAKMRFNIDFNLDGNVDERRAEHIGMCIL